ncbi:MAG: hypothetical protein J5947_05040 [Clostridium sp.]|nr:hypothetical protein [Clostridium sp.]
MMNIRFNLPEDTVEELDQYVQETMPMGYATSVSNLIKYGLYHQMSSDTFAIFAGMPWRILETEQDTEDAEIRRKLAEVFTGHLECSGKVACWYCASVIPMAVLRLSLTEASDVQNLIRKVPGLLLPQIVPEQDRSISVLYLPEANDRSNDVYDEMDRAEAAMENDSGSNILTLEF